MAIVSFYATTAQKYEALATPDENCLYFLDDGRLYKGSTLMGGNIELVSSFPATGEKGKIYFQASTGNSKIWTGTQYIDLTKEYITSITEKSTNNQTPTAKAVWDLVAAAVPADYSSLQETVGVHTMLLNQITNSKTGIYAKAQALVTALEEGKVAANAEAIETLKTVKADKATTLEGYGITDAYTKDETKQEIASQIANSDHLKREIVERLPSVSDADLHTIYMLPDSTSTDVTNSFFEYMAINGLWERIGSTRVDLTNYYTKTEVDSAISTAKSEAAEDASFKANAAANTANSKLNEYKVSNNKEIESLKESIADINDENTGILAEAKKYTDSKDGQYATKEQGEKADSALQASDIKTGETVNGSINVKGQDVQVKGLGSAAFSESSDFDPIGSAANAYNSAKLYANGLLTWKTLS